MTQTKQATTETKPTTQKNLTPAQVFKRELGMYEKTLVKLLEGNGVSVDKFMMVVDNAVRKVPALLNVDRKTLFASVLTAAEMGLEPNTPMGLSYLIPFKNQCQFIIGYQGVIHMLYRNDRIQKIMCEVVRENDDFDRSIGDDMHWKFKYKPATGDRGKWIGIFAIIHLKDSVPLFQYMTLAELEEIKACSQNPGLYGSAKDPQMWMYKKAVIKQCAKLAPREKRIANALNLDSAIEGGASITLDSDGRVIVNDKRQGNERYANKASDLQNIFGGGEFVDYENVE
jgi:recombination protein RecT